MAGNELWALFQESLCSNSELLQHVLAFLEPQTRGDLRMANRRLREAVGGTVSKITYGLFDGRLQGCLSRVFPAANELVLCLEPDAGPAVTQTDMFCFLDHVAATNRVLVKQLTQLTLHIVTDPAPYGSAHIALCRLLAQCTSLLGLHMTWQGATTQHRLHGRVCHNTVIFKGQGTTPEERRANMQQQLRAISSSPEFLAPSSWPVHRCLTYLQLYLFDGEWSNTMWSAMCSMAFEAASLADLYISVPEASELASLPALSKLSRLTALALYADSCDSPQTQLLQEVACLASLQELSVDSFACGDGSDLSIPSSWSQLARLTSLALYTSHLQLSSLLQLPALQVLDMEDCTFAGSLTQLTALAALTRLKGGAAAAAADVDETATAAGQPAALAALPAVPVAWQEQLRELSWHIRADDMHAISQLTALTKLHLCGGAHLDPELCWQLAALPLLQRLELPDATAPDQHPPCTNPGLRPAFRSLEELDVRLKGLMVLAHWTDVQPSVSLVRDGMGDITLPLAVSEMGAGWLSALLAVAARSSCLTLALPTADALQQLLQILKRLPADSKQAGLKLLLGSSVGSKGLGQLLAAADVFPTGTVHIANGSDCITTQGNGAGSTYHELLQPHFQEVYGLVAPGLRRLQIDSCSVLLDEHVAHTAVAAPLLQHLTLAKAAGLTDAALYALLGCKQLEVVKITGCRTVTGSAAVVLLSCLSQLQLLTVGSASVDQLRLALNQRSTTSHAPVAPSSRWLLSAVAGGSVQCSLLR